MSDPFDEIAAPDVISSGGEDFSAFAVSRWPGLVRQAFGLTGDRGIRLRRPGVAAGALGLAGIVAALVLIPPAAPRAPAPSAPLPAAETAGAPDGAETIMALPLSYPPGADNAATGYAVQVSPATAHLRATASDGSTQLVTTQVVGGRRYAAFSIGASLRLTRLTWLDAAGRAIASTTALPRYGYMQFQP